MQGYLRPNQRSEQGLVFQHYSAVIEINRYTKQAKNRKGMQQTATKLTIFGSRAVKLFITSLVPRSHGTE